SSILAIARSTVSTGLHELQSWGVVKVLHVLGDRRDHFTTMNDIWEIFRRILDERKRREIDPTLEVLQESVTEMEIQSVDQPLVEERVKDMLDFFETVSVVYEQYEKIPTDRLKDLFRMSNKLSSIVEQVARE
ncbi:MAG: GbsR/MarR family transcriptional regulator, partial [Anaerolineales bacterium]